MATKSTKKKKLQKRKGVPIEVIKQMLSLATSGFGLVAALAWNNFVQELVNNYVKKFLPGNSGLISLFIYAVVVTILAVTVTLNLSRVLERFDSQ